MNIDDVQEKLRELKEQISIVEEDMNELKPKQGVNSFQKITDIAYQYPLNLTYLSKLDDSIKEAYEKGLSYIALINEENRMEKLLFLTRISANLFKHSADELYKIGYTLTKDKFHVLISQLYNVKERFILDALLICNICGTCSNEEYYAISSLSSFLGLTEEDIKIISIVAKAILINNFDCLNNVESVSSTKWKGLFVDYIPKKWLEKNRIFYEEIPISSSRGFNTRKTGIYKKPINGQVVKKGEIILKYNKNVNKFASTLIAKQSGYVFNLELCEGPKVFLVLCSTSFFDSLNKKDLKALYLSRRKRRK